MKFTTFEIYKYSIPMQPFTIATGTMDFAQNLFVRAHTDTGLVGVGECSAFPMIVGETQNTCYELAKDFASLWKNKDALDLEARLAELDLYIAKNYTVKSAFDMLLYIWRPKMPTSLCTGFWAEKKERSKPTLPSELQHRKPWPNLPSNLKIKVLRLSKSN